MKNTNHVINALPLVADALGRKYGIKVHIGGERAYTNGRDIHLPALPLESGETVLNVARGFIDHEAAHLRITDFDAVKAADFSSLERHVWNTLEDFMVERKLGEMYPGCIRNFQWLIKRMFLEDEDEREENENPVMDIFNWLLLSARAFSVPELSTKVDGLAERIDRHYPKLLHALDPLVMEIPSVCINTEACIRQARKIMQVIQQYADDQNDSPENESRKNGQEEHTVCNKKVPDSPSQSSITSKTPNNNGKKDEPTASNNEDMAEENTQGEDTTCNAGDSDSTLQSLHPATTRNDRGEVDKTDNNIATGSDSVNQSLREFLEDPDNMESLDFGEKLENMLQGYARLTENKLAVAMPGENKCTAFTEDEIAEIRRSTTGLRSRLQGLLQASCPVQNRIGRIGRINSRLLARLAVNDARIFMRKGEREGINTAIHILLDASYSMAGEKINLAWQSCYAVACALEAVPGISVAVTSFPAGFVFDNGEISNDTIWPVLSARQRIHPNFKARPNGNTPLAEALWWVMQQMQAQAENRKIILILSDGLPDNIEGAKNIIDLHQKHGHEVYGIGIMTDAMTKLLPKKYCRSLYDLEELASVMFELLRKSMIKTGGKSDEDAA